MKFGYLIEPPFNYLDPDGEVTGCDVELAKHVLLALGISSFEPVETEFSELLPGLARGHWRMTTGLFATEERRSLAIFSRPIWALSDGLLVAEGNPKHLTGYRSIAEDPDRALAVIRDQLQHNTALALGVPDRRIQLFATYAEAASAVHSGAVDAYASVARAHHGFLKGHSDWPFDVVPVTANEKPAAYGSFAFATSDREFRDSVDAVLDGYLGTPAHRQAMASFGFTDREIDLLRGKE